MKTSTWYYSDIAVGGPSNKEYHLQVAKKNGGYVVNFQHGRRGGTLTSGTKTPTPLSLEEADAVYEREVKVRLAKRYKPSATSSLAPLAAVETSKLSPYPVDLLEEINETEADALIRSELYWMQVKENGERVQIEKMAAGSYIGYNRNGNPRALPSEVVADLDRIPWMKSAFLDGELVGNRYVAFNLLSHNGTELTKLAYHERFGILQKTMQTKPKLTFVTFATTWKKPTEKLAGMALLRKKHCEGAVFKLIDAPYRAGYSGQKKLKFWKSASCRVTAVGSKTVNTIGIKSKDNCTLSLLDNSGRYEWVEVGRASTIGKGKIEVGQIVEVKFLYATEGKRLYQPSIDMVRTDLDFSQCTLSQLNGKYREGCAQ